MELRHLRYFVAVADELNFTRAARKLHVAQPALSRQIRQLEEELGVKLLERNHHAVALTRSGRDFLAEARALLQQSEQAIRAARQSGEAGPGQLNLGYVWGLFHSLVPPILQRFRERSPETAVNLFDLSALQQAQALVEGRIVSTLDSLVSRMKRMLPSSANGKSAHAHLSQPFPKIIAPRKRTPFRFPF